jgi:hypothetical protein
MSAQLLKDVSLSAVVAGFVTVLVGFTSSAVIVFEAANVVGATPAEIASWMCARARDGSDLHPPVAARCCRQVNGRRTEVA